MVGIQNNLPFKTQPTDTWLITCTDTNLYDQDVTGQRWANQFKSVTFRYQGSKVHAYTKSIRGRKYLRVELWRERPDVTIAQYPAYVEKATRKLQEACGRRV